MQEGGTCFKVSLEKKEGRGVDPAVCIQENISFAGGGKKSRCVLGGGKEGGDMTSPCRGGATRLGEGGMTFKHFASWGGILEKEKRGKF